MPKEEEKEYLKILGVDKYSTDKGSCWIYHMLLVQQYVRIHHKGFTMQELPTQSGRRRMGF